VATYYNAEIRHGGAVIRTDVAVDVDQTDVSIATASVTWGGHLLPPNNTGLTVGQQYTLVLPEFAPAKIVITGEPNPVDGVVSFKGVGPLPRSIPVVQRQKR